MIRFLFVDIEAIRALTSGRQFQTSTFARTTQLLQFLKGEVSEFKGDSLFGIYDGRLEGSVLSARGSVLNQGVFYDFTYYKGFENKPDAQIVSHFQKVLKFALRLWSGNVFSFSEKILDNNKAVIFANSFAVPDYQYKILIDRNPYTKRLESRDYKIIQVYADTYEQSNIEPAYDNLRNYISSKSGFYSQVLKHFESYAPSQENKKNRVLEVSTLEEMRYVIDGEMLFEDWLGHLTKAQKEFVVSESTQTLRLEGAAGTGKTLTLILKAIFLLKQAIKTNQSSRIIFVTHSNATATQIKYKLLSMAPDLEDYVRAEGSFHLIEVTTLTDWCTRHLGATISETQLLERDAQDSKTHQYLLLEEVFERAMKDDMPTYGPLLSKEFRGFLDGDERHIVLEMLQFEIGVVIKGKAEENFDKYVELLPSRSLYNIPAKQRSDLDFLFVIYNYYKERLSTTDQYDVDDIVLTSLGVLRTPIWRRRKNVEGYDLVIVDETHLFNFNELSIFHYLLKDTAGNNIVFAIDKSQAVGDRGLTDEVLVEQLSVPVDMQRTKYSTVFRSSPQIIDLAHTILSSGAALFQGRFFNPLDSNTEFTFTTEDETLSEKPSAYSVVSYQAMIETSFKLAEEMIRAMNCPRNNILIVGCSDDVLDDLKKEARRVNKPVEILVRRADNETIDRAFKTNRFVLGAIDFVGGLEFLGVVLVGTDNGRVPPTREKARYNLHFINYAWHNRMYVAVTRSKYRVVMIYEKSRELSSILSNAVQNGTLDKIEI